MSRKPPVENLIANLEPIAELMPGNFYWKDSKGRYLGCNQALLDMLQFSKGDIIGKTDEDLWPEQAEQLHYHDHKVISTKAIQKFEEKVILDGSEYFYSVVKMPMYNENGDVVGIIGNSLDVTKTVNLQTQLAKEKIKAEAASRAKSEFIANMNHDIRTPIMGVVGMLQDLLYVSDDIRNMIETLSGEQKIKLDELALRISRDSQIGLNSIQQLLAFCNEILETSQLESGHVPQDKQAFSIREILQSAYDLLLPVAKHRKLSLVINVDDNIPRYLLGPAAFINRILLNLMSNALKFTNTGSITVSIMLSHASNKQQYELNDPITLKILVKDTGIGIPKDKLDNIFERFSRATSSYNGLYNGSGLGLYVVKHYLELMDGTIYVDSNEGIGTCFTIMIPFLVADPPTQSEPVSPIKHSNLSFKPDTPTTSHGRSINGAQILIVEDNPVAAMALKVILSRYSFVIDVASNGQDALSKALSNHYRLIFMDIGLPDISGFDVTQQIRDFSDTDKSSVPIVAITGHLDRKQHQACTNAGMQGVLNKPVLASELEPVVEQYLLG